MVRQQTPFRFTEREMDIAKGTDLPDLLTHLGYQVRRVGSYYTTREMDSLRIKERRTWRRYSNQTGGDAIAFLQEFCGKDFREAVNYLLEFNGHRARPPPSRTSRPQQKRNGPPLPCPVQLQTSGTFSPTFGNGGSPPRSSRASSKLAYCMRMPTTTTACLWAGMEGASRCSPASAAPMTGMALGSKEMLLVAIRTSPSACPATLAWIM